MPGNLVHVPISSHGSGMPGQGGGVGPTPDHQQFIPTSQYQNSNIPPHMWTQQVPHSRISSTSLTTAKKQ